MRANKMSQIVDDQEESLKLATTESDEIASTSEIKEDTLALALCTSEVICTDKSAATSAIEADTAEAKNSEIIEQNNSSKLTTTRVDAVEKDSELKSDIVETKSEEIVDEKNNSKTSSIKDDQIETNAIAKIVDSAQTIPTKVDEIKCTSKVETETNSNNTELIEISTTDTKDAGTDKTVKDNSENCIKDDTHVKDKEGKHLSDKQTIATIERNESKPKEEKTAGVQNNSIKNSASSEQDDKHAEHVSYTEDGGAIYTDPKTKHKYKWSTEENSWLSCDSNNSSTSSASSVADNPYENEHYKWCGETQQWLPKSQNPSAVDAAQTATETEHYKWDAESNEWVPKVQTTIKTDDVTYDIDADGQRIYTDKDGTVFFWDTQKNAWFPKIDDDFMARYQMNYGFIDNTSAGEEEKRLKEEQEAKRKEEELQRMAEEAAASEAASAADAAKTAGGVKRKVPQEPPKWFDLDPEHNTKVYVSNLPLDITLDEFAELMGKCGMIMRDPQTQKYKLKLYTEADGQIKGDGLCDYIKVESVHLALNILDESELRGKKIHVQRAKFQMRGEYNPSLKPKRKKKDKEKMQKMKEKLFDWRPEKMRGERSKNEKVVILKNLFDPDIFEKEVQLILDYQNDLREECSKCGTVRKIVIYDRHAEGVAQVNMASPEEADVVIQMMQGRFFGKRQLSAEHWDGKTKYKVEESETEVRKRLSNWDQFLETDEVKNQVKNLENEQQIAVIENVEETVDKINTDSKDNAASANLENVEQIAVIEKAEETGDKITADSKDNAASTLDDFAAH